MNNIRIALAQCKQSADFEENARTVFRFLDQAAAAKAKIVCFPETHTVGYRIDVTEPTAPVPIAKLEQLHKDVAKRCGELNLACILGTETPLESNPTKGRPYNTALVISEKGKILGVHHKTRLTPLDAVGYTPGEGFTVWELHGAKVGVVICFEGFRFAETTRDCVRQGAQLVFHPQNNTTRPADWKIPVHHAMITTRAAENTVWFASCNACHVPHQNCRSMVVAPDGQVVAQSELRQEQLVVVDIDLDKATHAMFKFDMGGCAEMLFGDVVAPEEYATAGPMKVGAGAKGK